MLPSGINLGPHRRRRFNRPGDGDATPAVEAGFNPADATIKAVLAHADGLDAAGVASLITAEEEGKNRSSLLRKLDTLRDEAAQVEDTAPDASDDDLGDLHDDTGHEPGDDDTDA